jgi:L-ascorbate metabolism protein UlaG (beta-lactamase superfamily)
MSDAITAHGGIGVNPGDEIAVGHFTVHAFYEYALEGGLYPNHPREANWTSYIVDIEGFTIFHAGDSANIEEYTQLTGTINVALLPVLIFNSQDVVDALDVIQPEYFIPVHFAGSYHEIFVDTNGDQIECEIILLDYYELRIF